MKKIVICLISLFVILLTLFTFKYLKKEKEIFDISFLSSNILFVDVFVLAAHDYVTAYDSIKVSDQIRGLYENGLNNGYITWNSASSLAKYKTLSDTFLQNF